MILGSIAECACLQRTWRAECERCARWAGRPRLRNSVAPLEVDGKTTLVLIRREIPGDELAIHGVHNAAFAGENGSTAPEALLVNQLRVAGDAVPELSLVAEISDTVVGHVLGSHARLDERPSLGLGPLGVLPIHQQQGIGTALMHAFLAAADALGFPEAVLLGDPVYYRRFGFRLARPLGVLPPNPEWTQHFQIRTLAAWTDRRAGVFHYAPAFDDV